MAARHWFGVDPGCGMRARQSEIDADRVQGPLYQSLQPLFCFCCLQLAASLFDTTCCRNFIHP